MCGGFALGGESGGISEAWRKASNPHPGGGGSGQQKKGIDPWCIAGLGHLGIDEEGERRKAEEEDGEGDMEEEEETIPMRVVL